jgi:hypothetical protein
MKDNINGKSMKLKEIYWEKEVKDAVWKKGRINPDYSPNVLRWDPYGRIMMWSKFEHTDSRFGWSIVPIDPTRDYGPGHIDNLQPVNLWSLDPDQQE